MHNEPIHSTLWLTAYNRRQARRRLFATLAVAALLLAILLANGYADHASLLAGTL